MFLKHVIQSIIAEKLRTKNYYNYLLKFETTRNIYRTPLITQNHHITMYTNA